MPVPLNWHRPAGQRIKLAVIRRLASDQKHLIGSMYARRATELARRCGQVSGQLLDNISTEDTARDLNYLRQLVGDRALTYFGLSYGTLIGQTYANLFPTRVRAMLLSAVVNAVPWLKSAEPRTAYQVGSADAVFTQFVALCQGAGPARCALARHPETAAQRVAGLFRQAQWAPCAANWPAHATERYTGPWNARTKTPILLINNTYDPATGYSGARRVERRLGNAVLLTVASYGHQVELPSPCADTWRVRYLVHLVTPPPGTVCGAQPPFR